MPLDVERSARRGARKRGLTGLRFRAYVYGTLRKTGWRPPRELRKNPRPRS